MTTITVMGRFLKPWFFHRLKSWLSMSLNFVMRKMEKVFIVFVGKLIIR